jgi:hypothetical protein
MPRGLPVWYKTLREKIHRGEIQILADYHYPASFLAMLAECRKDAFRRWLANHPEFPRTVYDRREPPEGVKIAFIDKVPPNVRVFSTIKGETLYDFVEDYHRFAEE